MKLTKQQLKKIIKEELQNITNEYDEREGLSRKAFIYSADRIANALQGAGASGDEQEIINYIDQVLSNPGNPPMMPGKWSRKVGGHEDVAAAIEELFTQAGGTPNRGAINALAAEIARGIRSRNEG